MRIYVDMGGVLCDYDKAYNAVYDEVLNPYPQKHPYFFHDLEPIEGAIEGMLALEEAGHDVYILTRPSIKNNHCWSGKAAWIEQHLGFRWLNKLIITCHKDLLFDGSSYLIDDVLCSGAGQQKFAENNKLIWFANGWTWDKVLHTLGAN